MSLEKISLETNIETSTQTNAPTNDLHIRTGYEPLVGLGLLTATIIIYYTGSKIYNLLKRN